MDKETLKIYVVLSFYFLFMILPIVILGLTKVPIDFRVDPTYMNGILAGSSILFGFWATILGIRPQVEVKGAIIPSEAEKEIEKAIRKADTIAVIINLIFLLAAIFSMFLCAIGIMFSVFALCFVVMSFSINLYSLIIKLIYSWR